MTASQDCMIRLYDTQNGNFAQKETIEVTFSTNKDYFEIHI